VRLKLFLPQKGKKNEVVERGGKRASTRISKGIRVGLISTQNENQCSGPETLKVAQEHRVEKKKKTITRKVPMSPGRTRQHKRDEKRGGGGGKNRHSRPNSGAFHGCTDFYNKGGHSDLGQIGLHW